MSDYQKFIEAKVRLEDSRGLPCDPSEVNPWCKPHQRDIVAWAVRGGQRAIFAAFGLGKSVMQLETLRLTLEKAGGGRGLIVAPLGVRQEFKHDAEKLGTEIKFIRSIEEAQADGLYITNYETVRDGKLNPSKFKVVSLDEASILRGFGGTKTFREFMATIAGDDRRQESGGAAGGEVKYRFVATATPSPNEFIELLSYAAFLGVMDVGQAKTRFFKRDSTKADKLTIHAHKEREFWLWVSSWAIFIQKPSDLNYDDTGYDLPPIDVRWHEIRTDHSNAGHERDGQGKLLRDTAIGIQDASREKRRSMSARIEKLMEIIRDQGRQASLIPESLLREEQGSIAGDAEGARKKKLSGCQRQVQGTIQKLETKEPRENAGTPEGLSRTKPGKDSSVSQGSLPEEQAEAPSAMPRLKTQEIRSDGEYSEGHHRQTRMELRDLRQEFSRGSKDSDRPLPQYEPTEGSALSQLQHGPRVVRGQSRSTHGSSGLSDQIIIWCDLNDEQKSIEANLVDDDLSVTSLTGSQDIEIRDLLITDWKEKRTSVFLSKPTMYGSGINMQQSHTMIFAGIGFKAQDVLQAVHRIHRFLQNHPCTVHFIYTEAEREVRSQLERKWKQHEVLVANMTAIIREFGLSHAAMAGELKRSMGIERAETSGEGWTVANNDTVDETARMKADSVGLILTSIPFATQYEYSPSYNDFGHTDDTEHFFRQMDYLTPNLLRVLQPGRIMAIHVKDRISPGGLTGLGFQTVQPFHADCIYHYRRHGFAYLGMKTIVTDVVRENAQTYRLGWTEQCKDGSRMGVGMPEYLLLFRKPPTDSSNGYADVPVVKSKEKYSRARWQFDAHGFERSSGDRLLMPEDLTGLTSAQVFKAFRKHSSGPQPYDFEHDVALAEYLDKAKMLPPGFMLCQPQSKSPDVWTDITRMRTLNGVQQAKGKEMHLCPIQFDLVDRAVTQWTNLCDEVYDPFGGLMTVPLRAVMLGRRGRGVELSPGYYADGVWHLQHQDAKRSSPTLFDAVEAEETPA